MPISNADHRPAPLMGNDIVDLSLPLALNKASDRRFCARVFDAHEQAWIGHGPEADRRLWSLWAAKEAAFKLISRSQPQSIFSPQRFAVTAFDLASAELRFEHWLVAISWRQGQSWVHALAQVLDPAAAAPQFHWTERPLFGDPSAEVRALAVDLLADWDYPGAVIVERPPLALIDTGLLPITVSLSHDGGWVAAAVAGHPASGAPEDGFQPQKK